MKRTEPILRRSTNEVGVERKSAKVCELCGEDCSSRPRTRDPKGRYFCTACYRSARARPRSPDDSADTASLTRTGTAELGLLPDVLDQGQDVPPCHGCGAARDPNAVVCTSCGLNVQTGRFEVSLTGGTLVTRIKTARGPSRWDRVVALNRKQADQAAFWQLVLPLAMLAAGFGVMTGLIALPGAHVVTKTFGAYAFALSVEVAVGVGILWGAATLWLGGAGPLPLAIVRVAGIFAVADALAHLLAPLIDLAPVPGVAWIVQGGVLVALLGWQFDLNLRDSFLVGLPALALKAGTGALLAAILG